MQLIRNEKTNKLSYVADGNEKPAEKDFLKAIEEYDITLYGSAIHIEKEGESILHIHPWDNSVFVYTTEGIELATAFGAKRFLVSDAREHITAELAAASGAKPFPRDLSFPLQSEASDATVKYINLADKLKAFRTKEEREAFYANILNLHIRCADFTLKKQEEYRTPGDNYCRFNLESSNPFTRTETIFLLNDDNNIIGSINAVIITDKNGHIDIYLYDEVVDYYTLLDPQQIEAVKQLQAEHSAATNDNDKKAIQLKIANIVEDKRTELLRPLFAAARHNLRKVIPNLDEIPVNAFIRATCGRDDSVDHFKKMGCGANTQNYVIHGPATDTFKLLDAHVKAWGTSKLAEFKTTVSSLSLLAAAPASSNATESNPIYQPAVERKLSQ